MFLLQSINSTLSASLENQASFLVPENTHINSPRMSVVVEIWNGMIARGSEEVIDCLREN